MSLFKTKSAPKCSGTHRLIWSRSDSRDEWSELMSKAEALHQFENCTEIRTDCGPHSGRRLRVVAESERVAALRRIAEAVLIS